VRVVSLLPAASEIVAAIGAADALVGVTHECDYPLEVRSRPHVTRSALDSGTPWEIDAQVRAMATTGVPLFMLDEPRIASLQPDVILTQALCDVCAVSETDVRAMAARFASPPRVIALASATFDDVLRDIHTVGEALGAGNAAADLVASIRQRLDTIHRALKAAREPRPRVAVIEWTDPVYVAGHWTPELVRRAGGEDVVAQAGMHSVVVTADEIAAHDPEVILVSPCGFDVHAAFEQACALLARGEWAWARGRTVWALNANALLSRPGPRLADAVETMARVFAPSLFGAPDPTLARRVFVGDTPDNGAP